jgi:SsrA-binding protein
MADSEQTVAMNRRARFEYHLEEIYEAGNIFNHDPLRKRKLLLHRSQIRRVVGKAQEKGYTLVPLRLYFKHGVAKVELEVARGKRQYDKRTAIQEREARRRIDRAVRRRR